MRYSNEASRQARLSVSECKLLRGGSTKASVVRSTKRNACAAKEYIFALGESDIIPHRRIAICCLAAT